MKYAMNILLVIMHAMLTTHLKFYYYNGIIKQLHQLCTCVARLANSLTGKTTAAKLILLLSRFESCHPEAILGDRRLI